MKVTLHDLAQSAATDGQVPGWDDTGGLWVPRDVLLGLTSADASVVITDNGDGTLNLAAAGGGGGGTAGVILIENGDDPADYAPAVNDLIFEKAVPPTFWDLRSLASLPTGWATRGSVATTFDAAGVSGTFDAGEGFYYTLGGTTPSGTLEAKEVSGSTFGQMVGPLMHNTVTGKGAMTSWYNSPSGALTLAGNSSHQYAGGFTNGGGTPALPAWFRIRFDHSNGLCYGSRSTDGTTWSAEATLSYDLAGITEVGLGSLFGSGTAKFEYLKWSPTGGGGGGLLGWWDGSDVVPF